MFRRYASNSHSYTHLILALGIVREPTLWGFITHTIMAYMTLACLLQEASGQGTEELVAMLREAHQSITSNNTRLQTDLDSAHARCVMILA